jgi:hypothetical protein
MCREWGREWSERARKIEWMTIWRHKNKHLEFASEESIQQSYQLCYQSSDNSPKERLYGKGKGRLIGSEIR